jgi:hypothetical protein
MVASRGQQHLLIGIGGGSGLSEKVTLEGVSKPCHASVGWSFRQSRGFVGERSSHSSTERDLSEVDASPSKGAERLAHRLPGRFGIGAERPAEADRRTPRDRPGSVVAGDP